MFKTRRELREKERAAPSSRINDKSRALNECKKTRTKMKRSVRDATCILGNKFPSLFRRIQLYPIIRYAISSVTVPSRSAAKEWRARKRERTPIILTGTS